MRRVIPAYCHEAIAIVAREAAHNKGCLNQARKALGMILDTDAYRKRMGQPGLLGPGILAEVAKAMQETSPHQQGPEEQEE